jgi:hypothetical protein
MLHFTTKKQLHQFWRHHQVRARCPPSRACVPMAKASCSSFASCGGALSVVLILSVTCSMICVLKERATKQLQRSLGTRNRKYIISKTENLAVYTVSSVAVAVVSAAATCDDELVLQRFLC